MRTSTIGSFFALALAAVGGETSAADFYKDKTISILTAGSAGGSYDVHTRLVATHITKHIPGNPRTIVQNNTAGHGIAAANSVFNVAKKDGTELGQFNRDALILALLGTDQTKFKLDEFNWIGTPSSYADNAFVIWIRSALPYKSLADFAKASAPVNLGNKGTVLVSLMKDMATNVNIVEGYSGDVINMALERAEIDGLGTAYVNVVRETPHWLNDRLIRGVVQFGQAKRMAQLPDVPTGRELARNADELALIKFCELSFTLGFPFVAPPGVPAERVALLRKAFDATMQDAEYIAAVKKSGLEFSPKSGEGLSNDIAEATKAPPAVISRYKALVGQASGKP